MSTHWKLPIEPAHATAATAGQISFVGGAGDFDRSGRIRHPDDLEAQIDGAMTNVAAALSVEGCTLDDVVRLKAYYRSDGSLDEWPVLAALDRHFPVAPAPAISPHPVPLQPFDGQAVQIQAIAQRGWRSLSDVRVVTEAVPAAYRDAFGGRPITRGLRAGELISAAARTATDEHGAIQGADAVEQSHLIMQSLERTLDGLGASFQDSIKMEGYYFGTDLDHWAPMAEARAGYFREPGPVATVVPCHGLYPTNAMTKIEVLAMRETWNGFEKYIPRDDRWPKRVWDWPIPVPYRQGIRLRDTIWTGGQVPFAPGMNQGDVVLPGELLPQTRFTMRYVEDILRAFEATSGDLRLLVCYFASSGSQAETQAFLGAIADCVAGPIPPITVVPQPRMHTEDLLIEIWGVAQG